MPAAASRSRTTWRKVDTAAPGRPQRLDAVADGGRRGRGRSGAGHRVLRHAPGDRRGAGRAKALRSAIPSSPAAPSRLAGWSGRSRWRSSRRQLLLPGRRPRTAEVAAREGVPQLDQGQAGLPLRRLVCKCIVVWLSKTHQIQRNLFDFQQIAFTLGCPPSHSEEAARERTARQPDRLYLQPAAPQYGRGNPAADRLGLPSKPAC